ncbi:hypothetical protein LIL_30021 (plasmid) [Leptospira interrogans serovar Linhai str. 56609]|uniref:hypothetical protein n=1 Tax=Leptospira interrogans TaxID=173 RepID=UPI0005D9A6DD|nr:hypothetical protein [Leptospira interrogans]AJR16560.1 hypothetical protein LIL_30021 [Leptospira interrogans serovar Linhai str. 56609]
MTEYYIYFTQLNGGSRIETITSRSLLGAKQKASRIFNSNQLTGPVLAIEIQEADSTDPFWVAHRFIRSKKWSSFA